MQPSCFPFKENLQRIFAKLSLSGYFRVLVGGGCVSRPKPDPEGFLRACREVGALNKVIIEAAYLSDEEKVIACRLAVAGRAHYVKTSTGFGPGGATVFDVALMR